MKVITEGKETHTEVKSSRIIFTIDWAMTKYRCKSDVKSHGPLSVTVNVYIFPKKMYSSFSYRSLWQKSLWLRILVLM